MKTIPMRGQVWQDYDYSLAVPAFNEAQLIVACEKDIEHALYTLECNIECYQSDMYEANDEDIIYHALLLKDREYEIYNHVLDMIGYN